MVDRPGALEKCCLLCRLQGSPLPAPGCTLPHRGCSLNPLQTSGLGELRLPRAQIFEPHPKPAQVFLKPQSSPGDATPPAPSGYLTVAEALHRGMVGRWNRARGPNPWDAAWGSPCSTGLREDWEGLLGEGH
ncbi:hypothetical protein KIL84_005365 [Mauremys mutica]|uniref:Uncharacterized protein n=1 Tax=Mauremys mutica TaxID=74926 RepID=A0A9D3XJC3_9SAUR|nr:hypothetical protein KIL84_005365 [Mauremys mutica]